MPDETHQSVIHRAVYDGLETIFDDYALPEVLRFTADVSRLRSHYAAASATYGYEVRPSLFTLGTFIGAMQLDAGRLDEAVSLFRYAVDLFPGSPDAHGQLADALEKAGRLEEALRSRKEALRRAGEGHRDVEGFRMQLEELRKRMT